MNKNLDLLSLFHASVVLGLLALGPLHAQEPSPSVSLGFGVDTTFTDVRNVVSLVRAYLANPDSSARSRQLWSSSTEFDRRVGDLTAERGAYQGFPATVVGVIPAGPGDSVYVVRILYARADSTQGIAPLALQRLYAVREAGAPFAFRLSSALPRMTSSWERHSKGPVTFWYAPGQRPNQARIDRAARFIDSVAALFGVPVSHLDVLVGPSMEEVERAIGLDFFPEPSGPGQRSGGVTLGYVLLFGNPAIGEAYLHEFVHAVLGPSLPAGNALLGEGVATWLGGSRGRSAREMYAVLHRHQESDPTLTLSGLIRNRFQVGDPERGTDLLYASGALIAQAIYRRQSIAGVRRAYQLKGDASTLLREIATELGLPTTNLAALDSWWRTEATRASSTD